MDAQKLKILAIVTARGGSKGIPHKNIVPLLKRPLIEYAFDAIKKSRYVNRIILTTDAEEIAEVGRKNGIEIPFMRPKELAEDNTPTLPVLRHAVEWLKEHENYEPDYILLVQPTSPLIKAEQIDEGFKKLLANQKAEALTSLIEVPRRFHPYHVRQITEDGRMEFVNPEMHKKHPSRQTDPPRYAFGNFYIFKKDTLMQKNSVEGDYCLPLVIESETAVDINDQLDLKISEAIMRFMPN